MVIVKLVFMTILLFTILVNVPGSVSDLGLSFHHVCDFTTTHNPVLKIHITKKHGQKVMHSYDQI